MHPLRSTTSFRRSIMLRRTGGSLLILVFFLVSFLTPAIAGDCGCPDGCGCACCGTDGEENGSRQFAAPPSISGESCCDGPEHPGNREILPATVLTTGKSKQIAPTPDGCCRARSIPLLNGSCDLCLRKPTSSILPSTPLHLLLRVLRN